ncbi:MAG: ubiquinol-cytochrome c reductase iron-sulfur subunit [Hyphomonadaceae bacterium]|nr:ubiquinol-cytochrome c reductase iron-sulfur subunit [Hyphomonadaceae bacterium]
MKGLTRRMLLTASLAMIGGKARGQSRSVDIDISGLAVDELMMIERGGARLAVRRLSCSAFLVLDTNCTHLGCPVQAIASAHFAFRCFCHGSQFAPDGAVLRGPAERPLPSYSYHRISRNKIRVLLDRPQ